MRSWQVFMIMGIARPKTMELLLGVVIVGCIEPDAFCATESFSLMGRVW
jgi:hypothetical protein